MADLPPHVDVLVIGAGLQGLVAAKTYLQLSPRTNLLILDFQHSVGGVWAKENLYPGLRTNNQLGTFEFTDFNISDACPGKVSRGEHIPGEVVHDYLYKYAERFGLLKRIRLGCKVLSAEHLPRGWKLTIVPTPGATLIPKVDDSESDTVRRDTGSTITLTTSKLLVSTGMTSSPVPISLPGSSTFTPPLLTFHSFRQQASHLLSSRDIHHVAIYGGAKSAYDAVYAFASRSTPENPKRVTWIIRESGHGPVYMAPAHIYLGPLRCWLELLVTVRLLTWFSPCIWGERDGFGFVRRWLHNTRIGRWVVQAFWKKLGGDVVAQTGLRTKGPEVAKLLPKESAFWYYGAGVSILNYESDIHDFVRDGTVTVVRADVERLDGKTVRLKGGQDVEVDAMICSTGWRWDSGIEFLPKSEHADLGIPSADYSLAQKEQWAQLDAQADSEILERFPMLATGPAIRKEDTVIPKPKDPSVASAANEKLKAEPDKQKKEELNPWRLFRGIAPPANAKRDLVFLGMMLSLQTVLRSEIAALWAYAYLNNALAPPAALSTHRPSTLAAVNEKSAEPKHPWLYETALFSRFGRWRYPMGYGARFPDFIFDGLPYLDMLMQDLGLRRWRKGWGWLGEVFGGAYMRGDYRGLVEEWRTLEMKIRDG